MIGKDRMRVVIEVQIKRHANGIAAANETKRRSHDQRLKRAWSGIFTNDKPAGVTFLSARELDCRWPLTVRGKDGQPRCCGHAVTQGSYCEEHYSRSIARTKGDE